MPLLVIYTVGLCTNVLQISSKGIYRTTFYSIISPIVVATGLGFLSASSADGEQSSTQSFVHMTSEPAMIGYTCKMFVVFTRRRRTNVFGYARFFCSRDIGTGDDWLHAQNVSWFCWDHPQMADKCYLSADNCPKY
jgi:hypothetical protein